MKKNGVEKTIKQEVAVQERHINCSANEMKTSHKLYLLYLLNVHPEKNYRNPSYIT